MFLIHGKRTLRIKKFSDHSQPCKHCVAFDTEITVYKKYFHLFFIPFFPVGEKTVQIVCRQCGEINRSETLQAEYCNQTKNPFYLYTGLFLLAGIIFWIIMANITTQKEKREFVKNPAVGDVYTMRMEENNTTSYYFLRVSSIRGDTVYTFHNNLVYERFVSGFNNDDYFVMKEEMIFTKNELLQLLEKGEINGVDRNYSNNSSFNRIK